jgi:hypothetical protein
MREKSSGLLFGTFRPSGDLVEIVSAPPNADSDAATWNHRCARWADIRTEWLLLLSQKEQSLPLQQSTATFEYKVEVGVAQPGEALGSTDSRAWQSRGRIVRLVEGDIKRSCALGAGIGKGDVPWSVENYLGYDRQVFHGARLMKKYIGEYDGGERAVELYGTKEPTVAVCKSRVAFCLARYTPTGNIQGVVELVEKLWGSMFGEAA